MILEFKDENSFLSNFYLCSITYYRNGERYSFGSSEHLFMSFKNKSKEWIQKCSVDGNTTPGQIKRLGRTIELVPNWEDFKYDCMKTAVTAKFLQNQDLASKLFDTGNQNIIEGNFHNDKIWGWCLKTNTGENYLGRILMEVRDIIKEDRI